MEKESHIPVSQDRFQGRFLYLLILILAMIIIDPLVANFLQLRIITDVFVTAIFITAAYASMGKSSNTATKTSRFLLLIA